jgi:hypothetical protein
MLTPPMKKQKLALMSLKYDIFEESLPGSGSGWTAGPDIVDAELEVA